MSRVRLACCVLLITFASSCLAQKHSTQFTDDNQTEYNATKIMIDLEDYKVGQAFKGKYALESHSNVVVNITSIPTEAAFLIFQAHTYQYNITLSYDQLDSTINSNRSVFGSNIGLYFDTASRDTVQVFLNNDNNYKVPTLLTAVLYNDQAPIPGGCNMEFEIEIAPYQKISLGRATVTVDLQPSSVPLAYRNESYCDHNPVQHDVYRLYLSEQDFSVESYFEEISNMLTVEDIIRYGKKIPVPLSISPMRRIYSAYPGTGSVYAVVTTYNSYAAAYVPTFTYACNPVINTDSCKLLIGALPHTLCALTLVVGFLSVIWGHRCFRLDLCIPLYLIGSLFGYTIAIAAANYTTATNIGIGMSTGIMMVITALILYCTYCQKSYRILVTTVTLGPFLTCIIYPSMADGTAMFEKDWLFALFIITVIFLVFLLALILAVPVSTMTCGIFSSFAVIVSIDYYVGSSMKYIIINMIRRFTVSEFKLAFVSPPFQGKDICLVIFWIVLGVFRVGRFMLRKNKTSCGTSGVRQRLLAK